MIISNATPLIAFARINQLPLLQHVVGRLVIPEAVAQEISCYSATSVYKSIEISLEPWISVVKVQSREQVQLLLPVIDKGEAEVIALALENVADLVLIDELIGRKVAESLNLMVSGSVGVLIRAKQCGRISAVKPLLEEIIQQGLRYNPRFVSALLQHLGE